MGYWAKREANRATIPVGIRKENRVSKWRSQFGHGMCCQADCLRYGRVYAIWLKSSSSRSSSTLERIDPVNRGRDATTLSSKS